MRDDRWMWYALGAALVYVVLSRRAAAQLVPVTPRALLPSGTPAGSATDAAGQGMDITGGGGSSW